MLPQRNEQQQTIADFINNEKASLIVEARAGCGKTYVVVNGVVYEIVVNNLGNCAVMAYNKAAALEFEARIKALAEATENWSFSNSNIVATGTVHSFGFRAWRYAARGVKVDGYKVRNLVRDHVDENRTNVFYTHASAITHLVSLAKQSAFGLVTPISDDSAWYDLADYYDVDIDENPEACIKAAQLVMNESVAQDFSVVDFDDMILAPLIHNIRMYQYNFVIIDEAQDTNVARRALALKLLKPTGRLVAVGDPAQAIYGFTGADSNSLDLIRKATNAVTLPLSITYRCPKSVVALANRIVPDLVAHPTAPEGTVRLIREGDKPWFTDEALSPDDAILSRLTKPVVETAYNLIRNGIGCQVEGRDIGEGLVQLAQRWKRITTLGQLLDHLDNYQATETQKWASKDKPQRAQQIEDRCETLRVIAQRLIEEKRNTVTDLVEFIRSLFGDTPEGERPKVVTLCTIHRSKGREWNRVYILNRATTIPTKWARKPWQLEQESNLEYVAITRAKSELIDVMTK